MVRADIAKALDELPADIRAQVTVQGRQCLDLMNSYLSPDEEVLRVSSAAARPGTVYNCLFTLTDKRLLFVAPAPQAVGWRLSTITKAQAYGGYFFVEGDAGEYSPGLDSTWGQKFEAHVKHAIAIAVLAGR